MCALSSCEHMRQLHPGLSRKLINHDIALPSGRILEQEVCNFIQAVGECSNGQPHVVL